MPLKHDTIQIGAPTYLSFGEPSPLKVPYMTSNSPAAHTTGAATPLQNKFDPIVEHGSRLDDKVIERLSFGSLSGAYSGASSAMHGRGRDPIPLKPEILHLFDRLEPDKVKQDIILTEHLTGQRLLPSTEQDLQQHLEKRAQRDI
jgi:hypothetical protein